MTTPTAISCKAKSTSSYYNLVSDKYVINDDVD